MQIPEPRGEESIMKICAACHDEELPKNDLAKGSGNCMKGSAENALIPRETQVEAPPPPKNESTDIPKLLINLPDVFPDILFSYFYYLQIF